MSTETVHSIALHGTKVGKETNIDSIPDCYRTQSNYPTLERSLPPSRVYPGDNSILLYYPSFSLSIDSGYGLLTELAGGRRRYRFLTRYKCLS